MTDCFYQSNIKYFEEHFLPFIKEKIETSNTTAEKIKTFFIHTKLTPFHELDSNPSLISYHKFIGTTQITYLIELNKEEALNQLIDKLNQLFFRKITQIKHDPKENEENKGPIYILKTSIKIEIGDVKFKFKFSSEDDF